MTDRKSRKDTLESIVAAARLLGDEANDAQTARAEEDAGTTLAELERALWSIIDHV